MRLENLILLEAQGFLMATSRVLTFVRPSRLWPRRNTNSDKAGHILVSSKDSNKHEGGGLIVPISQMLRVLDYNVAGGPCEFILSVLDRDEQDGINLIGKVRIYVIIVFYGNKFFILYF